MFTVWGDHGARWAARVGLSEEMEEKHCEAFLESAVVEIPMHRSGGGSARVPEVEGVV